MLTIFFGHHVLADTSCRPELKAQQLYDRLRYLQRTRDLVPLQQGVEWLPHLGRRDRLAAITFDDGYRDNFLHLLPVLHATGAPATIFIASQPLLDGEGLWFDRIRNAFERVGDCRLALSWLSPDAAENGHQWLEVLLKTLRKAPCALRAVRVEEILSKFPRSCRMLLPHRQMMSAGELKTLASDPLITIGAHTHTHTSLAGCDDATAEAELQQNLNTLEKLTGQRPRLFAYPYGNVEDFGQRDEALLKRLGLQAAATTIHGSNDCHRNCFALRRLPLGEGGVERFAWALDVRGTLGERL